MPQDEFERLLERCTERLSEITLSVPELEDGAPRPRVYSLAPAPPRPRPAPPPDPPLAPPPEASRPAPVALRAAEPAPPPAPERERPLPSVPAAVKESPEDDVFPPPRVPDPPPSPPIPSSEPRGRGRAAAVAAAAGLAAAGAFGVWLTRRPAADLDLEIGDADAVAVRMDKGDLLVAEGRELLDVSRDGKTLGRKPLDAPVDSICWSEGSLWSADGRAPSVIERSEDGRKTVFSLNHVPGALEVKGRYLWTAEKGGRELHQFLISRSILGALLQPLDSFELNGLQAEAFTFDDAGTLWLADTSSRRLYRLRLENGSYRRFSSAPLSPLVGPEGKLRDLTVDGRSVWILAEKTGGGVALRRIAVSHLDWTPS